MIRLEKIQEILKCMNLSNLSRESGLSYWKIRRVFYGPDPRYSWVEEVSDYIEKKYKDLI